MLTYRQSYDKLISFVNNSYQEESEVIKMKKWIKAEDGKVSQVVEFDSGSKIEVPLDKDGNLKWFDDTKLIKKVN